MARVEIRAINYCIKEKIYKTINLLIYKTINLKFLILIKLLGISSINTENYLQYFSMIFIFM